MRKNIATLAMAALLGITAMLQSGCSGGEDVGTADNPKAEMSNIKAALRSSQRIRNKQKRIDLLRRTYETAGELKSRWPGAVDIDPFLATYQEKLNQIPQTVYELSLLTENIDSFKWALNQSKKIQIKPSELLKFWAFGREWMDFIIAEYPETALPVYINRTLDIHHVNFFNKHAAAFKNQGATFKTPLETAEFNCKYGRFLAKEFEAAIEKQDAERIDFLLIHTPDRNAAPVLDRKTLSTLCALGDYLFLELKDEALACKLIELRYPLNRIDLSDIGFGSDFMAALTADMEYAVRALGLNKWRGPLTKQDTLFLLSLSPDALSAVDRKYVTETIDLCLKRNKTPLAMRLITFQEQAQSMTYDDYDVLLGKAIRYGNPEILEYICKQCDDMDIYTIDLVRMASNYKMFVKYSPRILTHLSKGESESTNGGNAVMNALTDVLTSTHHEASTYVLKKYALDKKWETKPNGQTLLMDLCLAGNLPAAKYLIEVRKANIHERTTYNQLANSLFGRSDPQEGKLCAMHFAAQSGNSALIKYLAAKRANVNAQSYYGVTPLMQAVSNGHMTATKMLLSLRANVNATMDSRFANFPMSEDGTYDQLSNAYRRASHNGHTEILGVLKKAGARP